MTSKEFKNNQPLSIDINESGDEITIKMPLAPMACTSESGKMNVLATSNGWVKTGILCPRTGQAIQVNIFVGTRA